MRGELVRRLRWMSILTIKATKKMWLPYLTELNLVKTFKLTTKYGEIVSREDEVA